MNFKEISRKVAEHLLSITAVFLRPEEPFTWASGIKSPIYCDNRLTLTSPEVRTYIENAFVQVIKEYYPECEVVMGTSTAGIAHAAIVGHLMVLPMGYVRGSAKDHGRNNQIEGRIEKGQKVVVIEDLMSTGGSSIEVVEVLRDFGVEVLGIASIFTYKMSRSIERLEAAKTKNISLCDLDTLLDVAVDTGYITGGQRTKIINFRNNPSDEGWMKGE